jgi:hypothetical protein
MRTEIRNDPFLEPFEVMPGANCWPVSDSRLATPTTFRIPES